MANQIDQNALTAFAFSLLVQVQQQGQSQPSLSSTADTSSLIGQEGTCSQICVKAVADQCTNRHPDNVVTKVLLHIQSKQIENSLLGSEGSLKSQDNRVSKESNFLPCYNGTVIPDNYIESRKSSFQAHLERISNYLIPGPGVWWEKSMIQLCSEMVIRTFVLENRDHLYITSAAVASKMYSILLLKCGMNY